MIKRTSFLVFLSSILLFIFSCEGIEKKIFNYNATQEGNTITTSWTLDEEYNINAEEEKITITFYEVKEDGTTEYIDSINPKASEKSYTYTFNKLYNRIQVELSMYAKIYLCKYEHEFQMNTPSGTLFTHTTPGGLEFSTALVKNGDYYVGSQTGEFDYKANSNATISKPYYIATTELPVKLEKEIYEYGNKNNYNFKHLSSWDPPPEDFPRDFISWTDAILVCNALSEMMELEPYYLIPEEYGEGTKVLKDFKYNPPTQPTINTDDINKIIYNIVLNSDANGFRLPTEAEWEIAARGADIALNQGTYGSKYSGSDIATEVGWFKENSNEKIQKYAQLKPNELNLYDMSGNLYELCWDGFLETYPSLKTDPQGAKREINPTNFQKITKGFCYDDTAEESLICSKTERTPWGAGIVPWQGYPRAGLRIVKNK